MAIRPMFAVLVAMATVSIAAPTFGQGTTLQGGVDMNQQIQQAPAYYPAPQMVGTPQVPKHAPPPKKDPPKKKPQPLSAVLHQDQRPEPPRQPMNATISQDAPPPGVLPNQFMGNWLVLGNRSNIQARPEYQNGIENIFTGSNSQTWNIVGGPGGYSMSSTTGVQSVQVGNCSATTAFLRYAHPVGNTVAQEAIVMQISPDGQSFQGMQRITIKKQGEGSPRAQVTYQLMGRRQ